MKLKTTPATASGLMVGLWLSLNVLSFKLAQRPGQPQLSLIGLFLTSAAVVEVRSLVKASLYHLVLRWRGNFCLSFLFHYEITSRRTQENSAGKMVINSHFPFCRVLLSSPTFSSPFSIHLMGCPKTATANPLNQEQKKIFVRKSCDCLFSIIYYN